MHPAEEGSDHLPQSITARLLKTEHLPGYYVAVLRAQLTKRKPGSRRVVDMSCRGW